MIRSIFVVALVTGLFFNLRAGRLPNNYTGEYGPCRTGHVVYVYNHKAGGVEQEYTCDEYKPMGCGCQ